MLSPQVLILIPSSSTDLPLFLPNPPGFVLDPIYWEINKFPSNKKPFKTYVLKGLNVNREIYKAEEQGFEPRDLLQSTVFKTAAIDHSAIPPVK